MPTATNLQMTAVPVTHQPNPCPDELKCIMSKTPSTTCRAPDRRLARNTDRARWGETSPRLQWDFTETWVRHENSIIVGRAYLGHNAGVLRSKIQISFGLNRKFTFNVQMFLSCCTKLKGLKIVHFLYWWHYNKYLQFVHIAFFAIPSALHNIFGDVSE